MFYSTEYFYTTNKLKLQSNIFHFQDVMTNFTASMRDATKCQESLVEKWFLLLVKTKLSFLGVQDAYFHTVNKYTIPM